MKKWVWNNFSLRILLLISQSFFPPCHKIWRLLFSSAHTHVPRDKGSIISFLSEHSHPHCIHWPGGERLCSVWAANLAAVPSAGTLWQTKGSSVSAAVSSCQGSIHTQGCSCLPQYINPLFCFNTLHWPSSSIQFCVLLAREKGKHSRTPQTTQGTGRGKDSVTQPKEQQGMSSYCHSPLAHAHPWTTAPPSSLGQAQGAVPAQQKALQQHTTLKKNKQTSH